MASPLTRWQALDRRTLCTRQWDGEGEGLVFNSASGDLHLLNQSALDVLDHLVDHAASLEDLTRRFRIDAAALGRLLDTLDGLGLIRPLSS
jgi:PqqD family protein of HPr-rel-A system